MFKGRLKKVLKIILIYIILNYILRMVKYYLFAGVFYIKLWQFNIGVAILMLLVYLFYRFTSNYIHYINSDLNKRKYRILFNVVPISIFFIVLFYRPLFTSSYFYIKHIILFIILAYLIFYNGFIISVSIIKNHSITRSRVVKSFIFFMVIITVFLLGNVQIYYINHYEIPPMYGCSYYDNYGNLIYNSQYAGSCPELENVVMNTTEEGSELSFTVHEEAYRVTDEKEYKEQTFIDTTITYHYDKLNRVIFYEINYTYTPYYYNIELGDYILDNQDIITFKKQIYNLYDSNKIISTHNIERNSYREYKETIRYTSELKPNEDNDNYVIDINSQVISDQSSEVIDLYNIDFFYEDDDEYTYLVKKTGTNDQIKISHNCLFDIPIWKTYSSYYFGLSHTEKEIVFKTISINGISLILNDFSRSNPYISVDIDDNNRILHISEEGINGFYNFTSFIENQKYGFRIKHYHLYRDEYLRYHQYDTFNYSMWKKNNQLSMPIELINDYGNAIYYPDFYPIELIYQKNPLLLEDLAENIEH